MRRMAPVVAALALAAAVLGLRSGQGVAALTEGDVIAAWAQRYVDEAGGAARVTDCAAVPHTDPAVWMVVVCDGPAARRVWQVAPDGRAASGLPGA